MKAMDKRNVLVYSIIFVVIAVAVASILISSSNSSYNVTVTLSANTSTAGKLYPYQSASFTIIIKNNGGRINQMPFSFYLDGSPIESYTVSIPGGQIAQINYTYVFPSNGTYDFEAVADPGQVLDIVNRSGAHSSVVLNVSTVQEPLVYTSIPNNGIESTQEFSLFRNGTAASYIFGSYYNIGVISSMFGPANVIISSLLYDFSDTLNYAGGATATYENNSNAYSLWLQGTINPKIVSALVKSFSIPVTSAVQNNVNISFAKESNTTSICFFYSNGWTKIISYRNESNGVTCKEIISNYSGTEQYSLENDLNSSAQLKGYSANFLYTNSTNLASSLADYNNSLSTINVFENQYGSFVSYIKENQIPVNVAKAKPSCNGITYSNGTTNICSEAVIINAVPNLILLNQTEITRDYTISIYSLINSTYSLSANQDGIELIELLNSTAQSAVWQSTFKNTCNLFNASLSCNVVGFDHSSNVAEFNITNNKQGNVTINNIACYAPGTQLNQSVDRMIGPKGIINVSTTCISIPVSVASETTTYNISINYTNSNKNYVDYGIVNITNLS